MKLYFVLFLNLRMCFSFNVLVPIPGMIKSIHGLFSKLVINLAESGHNVTFITNHPLSEIHKNINLVQTEYLEKYINNFDAFEMRKDLKFAKYLLEAHKIVIPEVWNDERIMYLWQNRNQFDLIIIISYYYEVMFPFLLDFQGVLVQICTPGIEGVSLSREGNWLPPSVVPSFALKYDDFMNFWERVINLPGTIGFHLLQNYLNEGVQEVLMPMFPQLKKLQSYYDRVALTLINGHFALDGPVPLLPSQIPIGTITAHKPNPLSKDLSDFVDGSGDAGVIYFSLGSIARSADIPEEAKKAFVEVFRRIPQRIIWKYEGDDLDLPPNVLTRKWLPQQDILGHPKTRVFISHCGNIGTQEAKYHGVPVLAVPIAFDQPRNAARMERKGLAIVLQWEELTPDTIQNALDKLLTDESYSKRLKLLSDVLQDQMETPAERAVWWLEYVVRHKGAPHLEYAGKRLSLFQYLMLDVLLFWFAVLFLFVSAFAFCIKVTCCRKAKGQIDKKSKKD